MWMIYGANGYSGALIAREATRRGETPILAGRDRGAIERLGRELQCPVRAFGLDRIDLRDVKAVLHCAGPFSRTSAPMVSAALEAGAHYLDITGEIPVFESIFARDGDARAAGVALVPGVGFDVVPTDALAAMLAAKVPGADELLLAFSMRGGTISPGTLKTMIEGLGKSGAIRRDGRIVAVPMLHDVREIPFRSGARTAVTIPWGDIATAYRTTGIPNIRVYSAAGRRAIRRLRIINALGPILGLPPVRSLARWGASWKEGPDERMRASGRVDLWGAARSRDGREAALTMTTPEAYHFTAVSAVSAVQRLLAMSPPPAGSFTPAALFGSDFVLTIPGVTMP